MLTALAYVVMLALASLMKTFLNDIDTTSILRYRRRTFSSKLVTSRAILGHAMRADGERSTCQTCRIFAFHDHLKMGGVEQCGFPLLQQETSSYCCCIKYSVISLRKQSTVFVYHLEQTKELVCFVLMILDLY